MPGKPKTCATIGCRAVPTQLLTYTNPGFRAEPITELVCLPCGQGYVSRPALKATLRRMDPTPAQLSFLRAVACDKLPKYRTLGALRRMANILIRDGWLAESNVGGWTRYSLTDAGHAKATAENQ
jgi:hypothetical protein